MNSVLIVVPKNSAHLVCELPRLFKRGGYRVTVLGISHWSLSNATYIDEFIEGFSEPCELIEQAAELIQGRKFTFTILSNDALIWALLDSKMDSAIKAKLYPITNLSYVSALDGKVGAAALWQELKIAAPPSKVAYSTGEAISIAKQFGFPVMLKISRSGGGRGVFQCNSAEDIQNVAIEAPFLVEKHMEGDLMSVEALFLNGRLVAYSCSLVLYSPEPFAPSLERQFIPCSEVEPILQTLGEKLEMSCLVNVSFLRRNDQLYLFELDFRPNRWVRHSELVGVDWSLALRDPEAPLQRPQRTKNLRVFPADFIDAVKSKNMDRILYWILNRNGSWRSIPYQDPKYLLNGLKKLVNKGQFL